MEDRQTCNQISVLELKALGTLDKLAHHLGYQGGSKSPPHIFFVLTNLEYFDLGTSLYEKVIVYILYRSLAKGNLSCDRQTDRQTHRQTDKQAE